MHAVRNEMSGEEHEVAERVSWTDPRVVTAVVFGLFGAFMSVLTVAGILIGIYAAFQRTDATREVSTGALASEMSKMNDKLDRLSDDVKSSGNQMIEVRSAVTANAREIERESQERKGTDGEHGARLTVLEKNVAGLQAVRQ